MEYLQKRAQLIVLATITLMVLLVFSPFYDITNTPKYSVLFIGAALGLSCLLNPKFGVLEKKNWNNIYWMAEKVKCIGFVIQKKL